MHVTSQTGKQYSKYDGQLEGVMVCQAGDGGVLWEMLPVCKYGNGGECVVTTTEREARRNAQGHAVGSRRGLDRSPLIERCL